MHFQQFFFGKKQKIKHQKKVHYSFFDLDTKNTFVFKTFTKLISLLKKELKSKVTL